MVRSSVQPTLPSRTPSKHKATVNSATPPRTSWSIDGIAQSTATSATTTESNASAKSSTASSKSAPTSDKSTESKPAARKWWTILKSSDPQRLPCNSGTIGKLAEAAGSKTAVTATRSTSTTASVAAWPCQRRISKIILTAALIPSTTTTTTSNLTGIRPNACGLKPMQIIPNKKISFLLASLSAEPAALPELMVKRTTAQTTRIPATSFHMQALVSQPSQHMTNSIVSLTQIKQLPALPTPPSTTALSATRNSSHRSKWSATQALLPSVFSPPPRTMLAPLLHAPLLSTKSEDATSDKIESSFFKQRASKFFMLFERHNDLGREFCISGTGAFWGAFFEEYLKTLSFTFYFYLSLSLSSLFFLSRLSELFSCC